MRLTVLCASKSKDGDDMHLQLTGCFLSSSDFLVRHLRAGGDSGADLTSRDCRSESSDSMNSVAQPQGRGRGGGESNSNSGRVCRRRPVQGLEGLGKTVAGIRG